MSKTLKISIEAAQLKKLEEGVPISCFTRKFATYDKNKRFLKFEKISVSNLHNGGRGVVDVKELIDKLMLCDRPKYTEIIVCGVAQGLDHDYKHATTQVRVSDGAKGRCVAICCNSVKDVHYYPNPPITEMAPTDKPQDLHDFFDEYTVMSFYGLVRGRFKQNSRHGIMDMAKEDLKAKRLAYEQEKLITG
jgi:hypothetical protein